MVYHAYIYESIACCFDWYCVCVCGWVQPAMVCEFLHRTIYDQRWHLSDVQRERDEDTNAERRTMANSDIVLNLVYHMTEANMFCIPSVFFLERIKYIMDARLMWLRLNQIFTLIEELFFSLIDKRNSHVAGGCQIKTIKHNLTLSGCRPLTFIDDVEPKHWASNVRNDGENKKQTIHF